MRSFLKPAGRRAMALLACGLVAIPAAAQLDTSGRSVTVPPQYRLHEAPGLAFWALSPFPARRQVCIVERLLEGVENRNISALTVRRNMGTEELKGGSLTMEVWMSDQAQNPWIMSASFADNRGPNHQKVFDGTINIPKCPGSPWTPAPWYEPFSVSIVFQNPFPYSGKPLCIETVTKDSADPPWWPIDASVEDIRTGTVIPFGTGCIRGVGVQPAGAEPSSLTIAATANFFLRGQITPGSAICMFGSSNTESGSLRLPFSLDMIGAPGCKLYNNVMATVPASINALSGGPLGLATVSLEIPHSKLMRGAEIYTQWVVADPGANPLGATFSNGVKSIIGLSKQRNIGWLESTDVTSGVGRLLPGRVPVLLIQT